MAETLCVITCVSNPLRWKSRVALAKAAVASWLKEPNVSVYLTECLYGSDTDYQLSGLASDRVTHVGVRAATAAWAKENLLNISLARAPDSAQKFAFLDADVTFRQKGWANRAIAALDLYPVVQPWTQAIDLGPNDEVMAVHTGFAYVWHLGKPIIPIGTKFWTDSAYTYPHPGYAWCWRRNTLDAVGRLYELAGMGAADHSMAVAMVGKYQLGIQKGMGSGYRDSVGAWSNRAYAQIQGKIGYTSDTIEHPFHGKKAKRGYQTRWGPFVDAGFDPTTDLKTNSYGVMEFAGNKPALELQWLNYLKDRDEDANTLK